eukprot:9369933-Ditylum_brightwellii.AAC.1
MGSVSSPGKADQKISAVTTILQQHPSFKGKVYLNLITAPYHNSIFNPALLEGRLELDKHSWQMPIVWIYYNDFLVHSSTYKDCCKAVEAVKG